jgi:hypothetical protein
MRPPVMEMCPHESDPPRDRAQPGRARVGEGPVGFGGFLARAVAAADVEPEGGDFGETGGDGRDELPGYGEDAGLRCHFHVHQLD